MIPSGFSNPGWLWFVLVVALLAAGYVRAQRRRARDAIAFANLRVLQQVSGKQRSWPRHVPFALLLTALLLATVALAGPTRNEQQERNRATVILAIDVSLSMQATDVSPSRLAAAQEAAKSFAENLTDGVNLGLVAFAGTASVLVSPTTERAPIERAIDNLQLAERTATGEAIFTSLQAISTLGAVLGAQQTGEAPPPARIVLLSDGKQTVPEYPDDPRGGFTAAQAARDQEVPVSTISFGTSFGTVAIGRERIPVPVDDASLSKIADISGGSFFTASTLEELNSVYATLEQQIGFEPAKVDTSHRWLIAAVVVATAGLAVAVLRRGRLP